MRCPPVPLEAVPQRSSVRCRPGKSQPGLQIPRKSLESPQKVSRVSPDSPIMILSDCVLSRQASGSQNPPLPISHRMAWLKSYATPFNTKYRKICQFFDIRSTFHSGQTRRPAPTSQYGVPLSSQVCRNVAQIW